MIHSMISSSNLQLIFIEFGVKYIEFGVKYIEFEIFLKFLYDTAYRQSKLCCRCQYHVNVQDIEWFDIMSFDVLYGVEISKSQLDRCTTHRTFRCLVFNIVDFEIST